MTRRDAFFATLGVLLFLALWVLASWADGVPTVCFEDMECWDCRTMGNMICGG